MKRRILSIITALALCLSLCPTWALAEEADPSLCKHHPAHTAECGYIAPTEGHDCGHQHTAECYTKGVLPDADGGDPYEIGADTENLLDCQHSHDSKCGYVQADPGTPCGFVCAECEKAGTQQEGNTATLSVQAMIDTLPSVEEVKSLSLDEQREVYDRLQRACDAYEALSGEEQGQIDGAEILEELFCWFNSQIAPAATEIDSGDFSYDLHWVLYDDGTLNITGSGTMPNYGGWVNNKDKIKKVVVGNGVASVGYMAFEGCTNLTEIDLPDSITSIDNRAFYGCTSLATIKWPNNLTSIGNLAFRNCTSLALTELPNSLTSIDAAAFAGCTSLALTKLPDGLTRIENDTFESCTNLALTELPAGVTSIGRNAFHSCTNLTLSKLPDGLQSIEQAAFYRCPNLALTELPSGLTTIEKNAFWNCTNLALTKLPDNITLIGNGAFYECTNLALTKLPDGLTSIEANAFYRCSNLALTELPAGVTSIGNDAFNKCASLALTRLPDQVTSIGSDAFCQCTSLVQIEVPAGVTSIGNGAFWLCTSLTEMTFTNSTPPTLGTDAFFNCHALKAIYVPAGATGYTQANNWPEEKIIILAAPSFTTQPQNATVAVGQTAVFSAEVSGEPVSTCQWQVKKGDNSWEDIPGATDSSYTTAQTDMSMNGWQYRCVATNNLGNTESDAATLTVNPLDLSGASVTVSGTYTYTGEAIQPVNVTVELNGKQLTQGTDYTVSYADNVSVGTDTAKVIITGQGNYTGTAGGTFTIGKANSSITKAPTATGITYGQALSDSTLTDGEGSVEGAFSWTAPITKPNAGTAQFEVTFTPDNPNYNTATVNVSVTVAKATPTLAAPTASAIEYGQKLSDSTLTGGTATNPNGNAAVAGNWSWASGNTRPTATGAFPVAFVPSDTANYNIPENVDTSVTVNATAPKITLTVPANQVAGGEVKVTCKVENPHDAAFKEGIPETVTLTYQIGGGTVETLTGTSFNIPEGTAKDTVITVTASTAAVDGKYTAATKTATVTVTDKIPVEISGATAQDGTYNGGTHKGYTGTPTASPYSGNFNVAYAGRNGTSYNSTTPPTNAGDYTVTISLAETGTYIGSVSLDFTIAKASITITADSKRADVGTAKPALTYTVTGLVGRDTLATEPTLTCDADMDTVGQYPITASGAAVPSGGNYNTAITYVPGTLNVTDPTIPVTGVTLNKASMTLTVGSSERLTATVAPSDATDKSVTWASSNTAVATVDSNGTVTAVSTGTATITVTTADGAKTAACTVTVRTNSSGGGSYVPSGPGSSTVTVPVSGDKGTVHVSASVSGTTATVSKIDTTQIENVIGDNGQASMVEIDFTGLGKTIDTVKLPAAAIKDIAAKAQNEEVGGLTVKLPEAEISFDANALSAIQAQAGSQITLTVTPAKPADLNSRQKEAVGSAPVFDLTLRSSSGAITDFRGGYATVSLPYTLTAGQNPSGVVVYYLDSTGNITPCTTMYDVGRKSAIFTTGHLSLYFVGYDPTAVWVNPFSDVAEGAWYYDAVRYASENGLMGGYGNGKFGPNDNLTRAQFAQILFNKEGRPVVNYLLRYNDVADGTWYTEAVRWATSQGIAGGYGNGMFGPNDNITREQLAVMLWRYAGSPAATEKELHFTDADKASGFALEALRWAVENGVMGGYGDGRLDPKGLATRAQVAQMLKNFIESQEDNA